MSGRRAGVGVVAALLAAVGMPACTPGKSASPVDYDLVWHSPDSGDAAGGTDRGPGADPADGFDPGGNVVVVTDLGPLGGDAAGDPGTDEGGGLVCSPRTRFVYVVTDTEEFLRFDPATGTFDLVGTLSCPGAGFDSPFSMAIDRQATAWVLYDSGDLYQVSTVDASCQATSFLTDQFGFLKFGMGFSSDQEGSNDETLFVSELSDDGEPARLGTILFPSLALSPVGSAIAAGSAELTGNGKAELWGFFPQTSPALVARIDKSSATLLDQFPIPSSILSSSDDVTAWAFAFWGGYFFVFVAVDGGSSQVVRLDPVTATFSVVNEDAGYAIVGAGVSSCAPVHSD